VKISASKQSQSVKTVSEQLSTCTAEKLASLAVWFGKKIIFKSVTGTVSE
jgi:hypothetical protein